MSENEQAEYGRMVEQNALLRSRLRDWQQLAAAMRDCLGVEPFSVDSYNKELLVLARYEELKSTIV